MTSTGIEVDDVADADRISRSGVTPMTVAAWASIGAGALHATAIGLHAEHRQAALVFTAVAVFQIGWGVVALTRGGRAVAAVGAAGGLAAVVGYALAKTSGIGFIDGLDVAESAQVPDTIAAALAAITTTVTAAALFPAGAATVFRPVRRLTGVVALFAIVGLTVPALVNASISTHDHRSETAVGADDHAGHDDHASDEATASAVAPKPYDPTQPIDLGGVDGVTPEQQARAENLIAVTLLRLPKFADTAAAEAEGFRSIRDGATGYEHYINWNYLDDEFTLDPDRPESLVYRVENGEKRLVSAMYMLSTGKTLDDVPDIGGPLTQWHIHDNLCFLDDGEQKFVAGVIESGGVCNPPLVNLDPVPMIHVWITPHECGPFAALEGVGAGQIAEGQERLCDHDHGA